MEKITGIHAVREALNGRRPIQSVVIANGRHGERVEEIVRLARRNAVPVRFEDRPQVDRAAGTREHQGVVAVLAAQAAVSLEELLTAGEDSPAASGLLVLLDGVEDPQNFGAIIQTTSGRF